MPARSNIRRVGQTRDCLGEGARYDAATDTLLWFDIPSSNAWRLNFSSAQVSQTSLGAEAAFGCHLDDGRILSGGARDLFLDGTPLNCGLLTAEEVFNDGAVHPSGQFLVCGSRERREERPLGHMWCLGNQATKPPWTFTVFNGPAFSPCGQFLYFADSPERQIFVASVDARRQKIVDRQVFAKVPDHLGYPDGMTCDDDGGLWSTHWDGGCITRYHPDGRVDFRVDLPVHRPTSLAFRGNTLFVTSAQLDDANDPTDQNGALLFMDTNFTGPACPRLKSAALPQITGTTP